MRSDRAASLYLFRPLNSLLPRKGTALPILMYHRVPEVDHCTAHPYYCTSTAVPVFEQQMRFLRENGYRTVSVGDAFSAAQTPDPDPKQKLVAITFDDGYRDFYKNALPILHRYGVSLPMFPNLTSQQQECVVGSIRRFVLAPEVAAAAGATYAAAGD